MARALSPLAHNLVFDFFTGPRTQADLWHQHSAARRCPRDLNHQALNVGHTAEMNAVVDLFEFVEAVAAHAGEFPLLA